MCTISSLGSDAAPAACPHRAIRPRRWLPVPGRPRRLRSSPRSRCSCCSRSHCRRRHRAARAAPARVRAPGGRGCGTDKNNNINDKEEGGGTVVGLGRTKCGTSCGEGEKPLWRRSPDNQLLASETLLTRLRDLHTQELQNRHL